MEKLKMLPRLFIFISFLYPYHLIAQDNECRRSGTYFNVLTPTVNPHPEDVLHDFLISSGYVFDSTRYYHPDRSCYIQTEYSNKGYSIYLNSADMPNRMDILNDIVGSLLDFIYETYPNPQEFHPVTAHVGYL